MYNDSKTYLGILYLIVALQILPFSDMLAKYGSQELHVIQIIWARFAFHFIFSMILCYKSYGTKYIIPAFDVSTFGRGLSLFLAVSMLYLTLQYMSMPNALLLWFTEPFFLILFSFIFMKEKININIIFASLIGFIGIVISLNPTQFNFHFSIITGVLSGLFYAIFLGLTKYITIQIPKLASVYQTGFAGFLLSSFIVFKFWQPPSLTQWLILASIGLIAIIAHYLIIVAFEKAQANILAPFTYSEIIMSTILSYVIFGEKLNFWSSIGILLVVLSGIYVTVNASRDTKTN